MDLLAYLRDQKFISRYPYHKVPYQTLDFIHFLYKIPWLRFKENSGKKPRPYFKIAFPKLSFMSVIYFFMKSFSIISVRLY